MSYLSCIRVSWQIIEVFPIPKAKKFELIIVYYNFNHQSLNDTTQATKPRLHYRNGPLET
jgi:hypothetical protein